jgi:hypothetical protein
MSCMNVAAFPPCHQKFGAGPDQGLYSSNLEPTKLEGISTTRNHVRPEAGRREDTRKWEISSTSCPSDASTNIERNIPFGEYCQSELERGHGESISHEPFTRIKSGLELEGIVGKWAGYHCCKL